VSDSARSPLSGCLILVAAVGILAALIGFSIWVPFRQAAEIEKFTQPEPEPVPALDLGEHEAAARDLMARLESFRSDLSAEDQDAKLRLSAEDLNLAVSRFEALAELRGSFYVREIADAHLVIDICYRLNGRPRLAREGEDGPVTADPRYLIGTIYAKPRLSKREFALEVDRLEVPGSTVPDGFMGHFSTLRLFEAAKDDPAIGEPMGRLTGTSLEDGHLVLARVPGDPIPETVSDESFSAAGGKVALFLGGAMLVFLALAGTILFIGYKAQLRKIAEAGSPADEDSQD
jgi:hypothetical protein